MWDRFWLKANICLFLPTIKKTKSKLEKFDSLFTVHMELSQRCWKAIPQYKIKSSKELKKKRKKKRIWLKRELRDLPGGPVVKALPSQVGDVGSIPGWGTKISGASWPKKAKCETVKQKLYCNKFNKDFNNGPHEGKKVLKPWTWWFCN